MARAGVFDDVDAVIMLHPFTHDLALHPFLGRRQVEMVFHGIASHAAAQPFMGRNALDAAVAAYQGIAALRQHLPKLAAAEPARHTPDLAKTLRNLGVLLRVLGRYEDELAAQTEAVAWWWRLARFGDAFVLGLTPVGWPVCANCLTGALANVRSVRGRSSSADATTGILPEVSRKMDNQRRILALQGRSDGAIHNCRKRALYQVR
jgi:hypothetical protein